MAFWNVDEGGSLSFFIPLREAILAMRDALGNDLSIP
jgi:hypothetical protein